MEVILEIILEVFVEGLVGTAKNPKNPLLLRLLMPLPILFGVAPDCGFVDSAATKHAQELHIWNYGHL